MTGPRWPGRPKRRLATSSSWRGSSPARAHYPGPCAGDGSVVRVWEETGPDAAPGLEWLLLCDQPVTDFARTLSGARQYTSRWLMEDFHQTPKTGLGAEKMPPQTAACLIAAVALLSLVALALVDLREKNRLGPDAPAEACGLTAPELRMLRHQSRRPLDTMRAV